MTNATLVRNDDAVDQRPEPGMVRQVLAHHDQLMAVRHVFTAGWAGARHRHPHVQLVYVVRGTIRVDVGGRTFEAGAGDSFVVDGDVDHQAWAVTDAEVLDVFTPARDNHRPG